jgi:hypothetical protein
MIEYLSEPAIPACQVHDVYIDIHDLGFRPCSDAIGHALYEPIEIDPVNVNAEKVDDVSHGASALYLISGKVTVGARWQYAAGALVTPRRYFQD